MTTLVKSFEPLVCESPEILILGTLPGGESLEHRQYYYSNSNRIWKVICRLKKEPMPVGYGQKKALLAKYRIALWDYYASALREGSNDNKIRDGKPNDICGFLAKYPTIKTVAINGFGKYKTFGTKLERDFRLAFPDRSIRVLKLPETSGGNANHGWGDLNNLANAWAEIFE